MPLTRCRPVPATPVPPPPSPRPPPAPPAAGAFLVSVVTGGSGACPVCRAPVTSLLRLGPDVRTTDGRIVALVLPREYWAGTHGAEDAFVE